MIEQSCEIVNKFSAGAYPIGREEFVIPVTRTVGGAKSDMEQRMEWFDSLIPTNDSISNIVSTITHMEILRSNIRRCQRHIAEIDSLLANVRNLAESHSNLLQSQELVALGIKV